jgi:hypothetical protein
VQVSNPEFDPEDYEGLQERKVSISRADIRKLEQRAKQADELQAKLSDLERRQAFADAGIPTEGPGAWFRKAYDGALEPDAIRSAFGDAGLATSNAAAATQQSLAGHEQARAMAAGATVANPSGAAAELATMRAQARAKRNGMSFEADKAKVAQILASEGTELDTSRWQLPKQLT